MLRMNNMSGLRVGVGKYIIDVKEKLKHYYVTHHFLWSEQARVKPIPG